MISDIRHLQHRGRRKRLLNIEVPVLHVGCLEILGGGEDVALACDTAPLGRRRRKYRARTRTPVDLGYISRVDQKRIDRTIPRSNALPRSGGIQVQPSAAK